MQRAAPKIQGLCKHCESPPVVGIHDLLVDFAKILNFVNIKVVIVPGDSVELPKLPQSREIGHKMVQRSNGTEDLGTPIVCISQGSSPQ